MKSILTFAAIVVAATMPSRSVTAASTPVSQVSSAMIVEWLNGLGTVGRMLDTYQGIGILLPNERQAIQDDLKQAGVGLDQVLPPFRVQGKGVALGARSWSPRSKTSYVTGKGRVIDVSKLGSAHDVFRAAVAAFQEAPASASLWRFVLPEAQAQSSSRSSAIGQSAAPFVSALAVVGDHLARGAGNVLVPVAGGASFGFAYAVNAVSYLAGARVDRVSCRGARYVYPRNFDPHSPDGERLQPRDEVSLVEDCRWMRASGGIEPSLLATHVEGLCTFGQRASDFLARSTASDQFVPGTELRRILGVVDTEPVPTCTPERAARVSAGIRAGAQEVLASLSPAVPSNGEPGGNRAEP